LSIRVDRSECQWVNNDEDEWRGATDGRWEEKGSREGEVVRRGKLEVKVKERA